MVDTIRQLAALQALLPDNSSGQISPQDLRDFLVSAVPSGRSATKVVASASTSDLQKAQADYVLGGPDINTAIAAAGEGRVELTEGTFTLASPITDQDKDNITLEGQGLSTIITVGTDAGIKLFDFSDTRNPKTGWVFRNFKVDGNKANQGGTAIDSFQVFRMNHLADGRFENVEIVNAYSESVRLEGTSVRNVITRCKIKDSLDAGILLIGAAVAYNKILGNWIGGTEQDGGISIGSGASHNAVIGNTIDQGAADGSLGILVEGPTGSSIGNKLCLNTIVMVAGTTRPGIQVANAETLGLLIEGNWIEGAQEGVLLAAGTLGVIVGFNHITGCATGIKAVGDHHDIQHNKVWLCTGSGLWIQGDYNDIIANESKNNVTAGIYLDTATHCKVQQNRCTDDQGVKTQVSGIQEGNGADFNDITDNNVEGNKTNNIKAAGIGASTVVENNRGSIVDRKLIDPGNAGAIPVTKSGHLPLVTAGAETRTLAAPDAIGRELTLYCKTFVGNAVVTCATTVNEAGNNTITFTATGQACRLYAVEEGSTLRWRLASVDGAQLSTV